MSRRVGERGEGNLGCILWAAALGLAVLIAVKMVPVKIASSQLYDFMEQQAQVAAAASPEAIAKSILDKARELDLPLAKEDLTVNTARIMIPKIKMRAVFTVPVDFPGYTYLWHFDHQVNRDIYIF
ncbi:MAG TPA: hypothetical protein VKY89_14210 [Thermoanaerobaculia bacterium]|nr:hypothetical protein [Thermoanaerobaculia bacterium]